MKRLLALALGGLGLGAWLRRRRSAPPALPSPADELREKLAESRAAEDEAPPPPEAQDDVADRRRDVHDRARGAIDDLS
ncbi:MAG: hypothetical protein JO186_00920 [Actinobacteria bacterium]|nr:hypothetical protein [Actinomycetota bacterium]MBV8396568.1 hypothetical protein [Actinomycetota bacterium]MBV8598846.1 hypothetical protein [Actinomycetota bacterium]